MPIQDRNRLKSWFETGDYPTQQQFWDLIDSFLHRLEDTIDIDNVQNLRSHLNAKADYEQLQTHFSNVSNPHQVTKEQVGLSNLPNEISSDYNQDREDVLATIAAVHRLSLQLRSKDVEEATYETNGSYGIRRNNLLEKIVVIPATDITLSIGSSAGEKDILDDLPLTGGKANVIQLDQYAYFIEKKLFFSGITSKTVIRFYAR
ncbi:hypothetical protein [Chitinophaga flava]|uniref:Uncharacterized protein n=1 Tax=Chitinophaga flava TaxID=2259036 RepID=A0A365XS16_9BACT|nr:hypothetical protein [Chitinophaga flava]RBL88524.1 hypothetical protein DF182_18265 [Chitinophaga flava]